MEEKRKSIAAAIAAVAQIDELQTILKLVCDATGMRAAALAHVEDDCWTVCAIKDGAHLGVEPGERLNLGEPPRTESGSIVRAAGSVYVANHVAAPIILADGSSFGMLCALDPSIRVFSQSFTNDILKDFAAIIAAQVQQRQLRDGDNAAMLDVHATGQLREQFIAILGHDLRNPLHAIAMSSDLLARRLTDPALSEVAIRIKANSRRMFSLIDDVLDFARARLGSGLEVALTEVGNVNAGLTLVIQELTDAQPDCEIVSEINVDRSVRCDLGRLQQVASNLLANALTHGRPQSAIKITARADEKDLVLEVWNAGEPIPPESIGKIFEPFWRHSVSASRNGLGLGLHICSQIVHAHGGSIAVASTLEAGTRFTARLPLCAVSRPVMAFGAAASV